MAVRWRDRGVFDSIRVRILAAVVFLLASSSAVSIVLLRDVLLDRLDEEVDVSLEREAQEFTRLYSNGRNPNTSRPFGTDVAAAFDTYFQREVADDGETLLGFLDGRIEYVDRAPDGAGVDVLSDGIAEWITLDERREGSLLTPAGEVRYLAIPLGGEPREGLFVLVNLPAAERGELERAVRTQALTVFGAVLLAALIGLALAGRVLRPLGSLADTAQAISGTDITRRIPVRGRDEASRIATAFNDMLERLERAFTAQRQFLDDASHELRAPLTVIRGHVELLELQTDPQEREETTALVIDEIERMNRIVEDLLLLTRARRPDFLTIAPVDIAELTADVHRKAAVMCERRWLLDDVADVAIAADPQRLTQAMMQLAHNVCQHTQPGTTVRIGSAAADGSVVLWVEDDGPGVPAADAGRIFERLVKGGYGKRESSGLGLSIVAAIAEAHGGRARLVPARAVTDGSGARFEIELPARSTTSVDSPSTLSPL